MFRLFIILLFSFLFSKEGVLFSLKNHDVFLSDFYQQVPYNDWVQLDSLQKESAVNSFLERELVYFDALSYGVDVFPDVRVKLQTRFNHLLVNNTYENLVAFPLIDSLSLFLSKKHIKEEVLAYHLLVGYKGCSLPSSFTRTKEEAFDKALSLKSDIESSFTSLDSSGVVSSFSSFASSFSEDPSVKDNNGFIGWISWGRVMSSFQQEAFNLPLFSVSSPVLTQFGYHLILIINKRNSQFAYYDSSLLDDLSKKICLQSIPFDSLRAASTAFDSSLASSQRIVFNKQEIDRLYSIIKEKEKSGSRGNKGAYLQWFSETNTKGVCFLYDNKAFGLGWFLYHLKKTPSTRVNSIKSTDDLKNLFKSFVLQDRVILLGKKEGVSSSPFFIGEYINHKKNILKSSYLSYLIESLPNVDSSLVQKAYDKGVYNGKYIAPKRVAYTEFRGFSEDEANMLYNQYLSEKNYSVLLKERPKPIENTAVFTKKDPVVVNIFSMEPGVVSGPIKNKEGSFSLVRVEKVFNEIPWDIGRVYSQIERKIKKENQDSIKKNLLSSLKEKYKITSLSFP